mmetsp:Transcript_20356/g.41920  ORF Transcript_20356/g.41920 Transcript_20356/m.41920 type:complete len:183 (+) Transcript_20356:67-615(+)
MLTTKAMEQFTKQESCKPYFESAYGYAVFENIGKVGVFFVGGATGEGTVCIKKEGQFEQVGTSTMMQASVGPQFGGQLFSMIIFFETERDYNHFIIENFEFGADANVVALTASAGGKATTMDKNIRIAMGLKPDDLAYEHSTNALLFTKGMAVFTSTVAGLMYEASLSGQKYKFKALETSSQ